MKKIKITQSQLDEIIKKEREKYLYEGIDYELKERVVSYNPSHEENVDTSAVDNPTFDDTIVNGVRVWSIFKRKRGNKGDGNPLIYALKGENGWHFRSEEDRLAIERQFDLIANKFVKMYNVGITVIVPSSNGLNHYIASKIVSKSPKAKVIDGVVCKLTADEVYDIADKDGSKFREYYKDDLENALVNLRLILDQMNDERNGTFTRHLIKDQEMRQVLDTTFKISDDRYAKYANKINGQDILIIDDTISHGQTIDNMCKIIKTCYAPKSITVLTLLSKLY